MSPERAELSAPTADTRRARRAAERAAAEGASAPLPTRRQLREAALAAEDERRERELVAEFERLLAAQRAARLGALAADALAPVPASTQASERIVAAAPASLPVATLPLPSVRPAPRVTRADAAVPPPIPVAPPLAGLPLVPSFPEPTERDIADTAAMLSMLDRAPAETASTQPVDADQTLRIEDVPELSVAPSFEWPDPRPRRSPRATGRHWVPRLAVLAALGAATIVVPLTASSRPEAAANVPRVPLATSSALDGLATTDASLAPAATAEAPSESSTLAADQLAEARAVVSASRSSARGEVQCAAPGADGNGALAAIDAAAVVDVVMPLQDGTYRVTSQYGYRSHPIWGGSGMHTGVDFAAPSGTAIHAIAGGEVIYTGAGKDGRSGQLVIIEHEIDGQTVWSWYVHMYPSGVYVSEGDQVLAGDVIGAVGSYGNSTGPHLHLEIHVGEEENTVDPPSWLTDHRAMTVTTSGPLCS